jgi:preprotein translocase subunit SecY
LLSAFVSAFRTPDLRRKILVALGLVALYRIGALIPSPGVDYKVVRQCVADLSGGDQAGIYSLINMISGGALLQLSIFAIGIMPYITSSIIIQLLQVVIPRFEELRKEGQSGQTKLTQYTRYLTVALALLQATGMVALAARGQLLQGCQGQIIADRSIFGMIIIVLVMTSGAVLVMWFGEVITEKGIGNGMSLLIFSGIASRLPSEGSTILETRGGLTFTIILVCALLIIAGVVFVEQGQRRIPVQYAKRMVGRKMYGGTSTYLPLKVNQAGIIPVIFASSILYLPVLIAQLTGMTTSANPSWWQRAFNEYLTNPSNPVYMTIYFLLIIGFVFMYVALTFNPEERAEEMKKFGGFIPGIRPGRPTAEYLNYVLNRITVPGSLYLGIIAVLPQVFLAGGQAATSIFGGAAVLILVSVALDTVKQIESQLMQRNYEGFLK